MMLGISLILILLVCPAPLLIFKGKGDLQKITLIKYISHVNSCTPFIILFNNNNKFMCPYTVHK